MTSGQESKRLYAYSDICLALKQVQLQMKYSNAINSKHTQTPSEKGINVY